MTFDRDIRIGRRCAFGVMIACAVAAGIWLYFRNWSSALTMLVPIATNAVWLRAMTCEQYTRDLVRAFDADLNRFTEHQQTAARARMEPYQ